MGTTQAHANAFAPFNGWASSSNPSGDLKSLDLIFVFSDSPSLLAAAVPAAWAWDGGGVGLPALSLAFPLFLWCAVPHLLPVTVSSAVLRPCVVPWPMCFHCLAKQAGVWN